MEYYPVLIPTLNRYDHFRECVESLAECTHANQTEIVIGLDYPPSDEYTEGWKKIKEFIPDIKGFKKVTLLGADKNLGANNNLSMLKEYAENNYDARIITEDDNVFSPCFLDYMNKALEKYKNDTKVIAISGYMIPINWSVHTSATVVHFYDYSAWGIGEYTEKWKKLDETMPQHYMKYVCSHKKVLRKLKKHPRDLYQLIFWTKNNPSLDYRNDFTISCHNLINEMHVICPLMSLVRNKGHDGSGVNCGIMQNDYLGKQPISSDSNYFY